MRTNFASSALCFLAVFVACEAPDALTYPQPPSEGGEATGADELMVPIDEELEPGGVPMTCEESDESITCENGLVVQACSDGIINGDEGCDDGNAESGDGCTATCAQVEADYVCPTPGEPCVYTVSCGDGRIGGEETCDDAGNQSGDGCTAECQTEYGWACPIAGTKCFPAECGDGIQVGVEQCDDSNALAEDGCDANCQLEPGFACDTPGMPCHPTTCGDGVREGSESCDDGNLDPGDGCGPTCRSEPVCERGVDGCSSPCGDGLIIGAEECDDGNLKDGDGCSASCTVEEGYTCAQPPLGDTISIPITYRDFKASHPDFEPDTDNSIVVPGMVQDTLSATGKPVLVPFPPVGSAVVSAVTFSQWYTDSPASLTVADTLTLDDVGGNVYQFRTGLYFPLTGRGWQDPNIAVGESEPVLPADGVVNDGLNCLISPEHFPSTYENFYFTSELRFWFRYEGGERLEFVGDDDVWVFVNNELAVDLGGIHPPRGTGRVCYSDVNEGGRLNLDARGLTVGNVYEIVLFQAERKLIGSAYSLALTGFNTNSSECTSVCGDGVVTIDEVCDDGVNDGSYGTCNPDCTRAPICGDGVVNGAEDCDDGVNLSRYGGCAPGCIPGPSCGDGEVQSDFEQCDDGINDSSYNTCTSNCDLGPRCGDGDINGEEQCDDGNRDSGDGCSAACTQEVVR